jgi:hypothetical protein
MNENPYCRFENVYNIYGRGAFRRSSNDRLVTFQSLDHRVTKYRILCPCRERKLDGTRAKLVVRSRCEGTLSVFHKSNFQILTATKNLILVRSMHILLHRDQLLL